MSDLRHPWERQAKESVQAFEAFTFYRDQDPADRSLARVVETLGKHRSLIHRWSQLNHWVSRVNAWDAEQAKAETDAKLRARRAYVLQAEEDHLKRARLMQLKGQKVLGELPEGQISAAAAARLIAEGIKLERLILGEATEHTATSAGDPVGPQVAFDFSEFSDAELSEFERLLSKAQRVGAQDASGTPDAH